MFVAAPVPANVIGGFRANFKLVSVPGMLWICNFVFSCGDRYTGCNRNQRLVGNNWKARLVTNSIKIFIGKTDSPRGFSSSVSTNIKIYSRSTCIDIFFGFGKEYYIVSD